MIFTFFDMLYILAEFSLLVEKNTRLLENVIWNKSVVAAVAYRKYLIYFTVS